MIILTTSGWSDYELIDSGNGKRLERFGKYILSRPDPQIIWQPLKDKSIWQKADAIFEKIAGDKGYWNFKTKLPDKWQMSYKDLHFWVKLTPFKHTGVFPEQSLQWDWIEKVISNTNNIQVLNLFGYTGIASLVAAKNNAKVTHLDASRSTIAWARENQTLSNLNDKPIRWILDDAIKFCQREIRRGIKYDAIIMDPPIYGHGPNGEVWDFNQSFSELLKICQQLLSNNPLFIIINAYAISSSALMIQNMLKDMIGDIGQIEVGELSIQQQDSDRLLSTGIFGRWSNNSMSSVLPSK